MSAIGHAQMLFYVLLYINKNNAASIIAKRRSTLNKIKLSCF